MATIRALDGTVDLTAGGTITVDSEGKTAAYTEFSGNIDFNGKTVISGAGIGAWSTTDSKIGMNPYGEETSKITFNDFVTMDPVNIGAKAQYNGDIIFNKALLSTPKKMPSMRTRQGEFRHWLPVKTRSLRGICCS